MLASKSNTKKLKLNSNIPGSTNFIKEDNLYMTEPILKYLMYRHAQS